MTTAVSIVVLDVETTGKERATDQIIELCLQIGLSDDADRRSWRMKPTVPIHPEAVAVHGITEVDLADCPPFAEFASVITAFLEDANVIVGYNVAFDLDMLQAELARAGLPPLELHNKQVVDVLRLWHHVEPRTLAAAHERFCGEVLEGAHQARADVSATARVLDAMLEAFGLLHKDWHELAAIADPFTGRKKWLGPSPHFQWDGDDVVVSFGKYRGKRLCDVDRGFLRWVLGKDFPHHVKEICSIVLEEPADSVDRWLAKHYPRVG